MNWFKYAQIIKNAQSYQQYKIVKGDNLSSIAKKYLGNAEKWTEIAQANPGIDPNNLQIGPVINIPSKASTPSNVNSTNQVGQNSSKPQSTPPAKPTEENKKADMMGELRQQIMQNEASGKFRSHAYNDPHTQNIKKSIGYGFHLDEGNPRVVQLINSIGLDVERLKRGEQSITEQQAQYLMDAVISDSAAEIETFIPNLSTHPIDVQKVLLDMYYNMGINGFGKFKRMHAAVNRRDYATAAREMMTGSKGGVSTYAKQVKGRAQRLRSMMENAK